MSRATTDLDEPLSDARVLEDRLDDEEPADQPLQRQRDDLHRGGQRIAQPWRRTTRRSPMPFRRAICT